MEKFNEICSEKPKNKRHRCRRPDRTRSVSCLNNIEADKQSTEIQISFESKKFEWVLSEDVKDSLSDEFLNLKLNWLPLVPIEDANQMIFIQKIKMQQMKLEWEKELELSFSDSSEEESIAWCVDVTRGGMARMPYHPKHTPTFFTSEKRSEPINDWTDEEKNGW